MNAVTDRRAVLGAVLAGGAGLSVLSWAEGSAFVSDPARAAIERHRRAYDAFINVWGQTHVLALYDRADADEGAAAELRRFRELEIEEEAAFSALLATKPATKAAAIASSSTPPIAAWRRTKCGLGSRCSSNRRWYCERRTRRPRCLTNMDSKRALSRS